MPKFFTLNGRISRQPLWLLLLISVGVSAVAAVLGALLAPAGRDADTSPAILENIPAFVASLVLGVVNFCYQVRRCHDRGRSGWFLLLWILPILNVWGFIELYCLAGEPHANRFGTGPFGADPAVSDTFL